MAERRRDGRYDRVEEATHPGPALPRAPRRMRGKVEIAIAAVDDPNPVGHDKLRRQKVAVNIARDPLEREHRYGRISPAAYRAGRAYERVLEEARIGVGGSTFGEPSSGGGNHEGAVVGAIDRASASVAMQDFARRAVGQWGELTLRMILGRGLSFTEAAAARGKPTKAERAKVAAEFREALTGLAKEFDRVGWLEAGY